MKKFSYRTAFACVFVCLFAAASAWAQSSSGTVTGRVIDSSGAAIAEADVQLIDQATKDTRKVASTADGDFLFSNVQPGTFTLTVRAAGFKRLDKSDINLTASDRLAIGDLRLEVGDDHRNGRSEGGRRAGTDRQFRTLGPARFQADHQADGARPRRDVAASVAARSG